MPASYHLVLKECLLLHHPDTKGILKHPLGLGGAIIAHPADPHDPRHSLTKDKQRWSDLTQSENQESSLSVSDNNRDSLTDVERTLKSLNGYHEEILEALQASAHGLTSLDHHGQGGQGRPSPGAEAKKGFADPLVDYGGKNSAAFAARRGLRDDLASSS